MTVAPASFHVEPKDLEREVKNGRPDQFRMRCPRQGCTFAVWYAERGRSDAYATMRGHLRACVGKIIKGRVGR